MLTMTQFIQKINNKNPPTNLPTSASQPHQGEGGVLEVRTMSQLQPFVFLMAPLSQKNTIYQDILSNISIFNCMILQGCTKVLFIDNHTLKSVFWQYRVTRPHNIQNWGFNRNNFFFTKLSETRKSSLDPPPPTIYKILQNSLQILFYSHAVKLRVLYLSVATFCVLNIAKVATSNSTLFLSEENNLSVLIFH